MGIRILWLQGWQRPYWGSRRTTRTATTGTRTGSSSFFFKYTYDICLYANSLKGIQSPRLQVWQRSCRGSRWTMRTATPGTRTGSSSFFFKYAYDTCLYVNFSMGIRILRLQVWQRQYWGSRGTTRTATPGTRTGSSSFFQIYLWYMFICQFFKENPNSEVTSVTKVMSRVQENNENGNPRDQGRE